MRCPMDVTVLDMMEAQRETAAMAEELLKNSAFRPRKRWKQCPQTKRLSVADRLRRFPWE